MSASMNDILKRRKLDALKRGVHKLTGDEAVPIATHVVGIGRAGARAIAETISALEPGAPKMLALAVDIGDQDLRDLRALASATPPDRAEVITVALDVPERDALLAALERYPEYLKLEYPRFYWNTAYEPWLARSVELPRTGDHIPRAVAKAVYGQAFYGGNRALQRVLRDFAASIEAANAQAVIAVVFGLGGGTGSGIGVDLARHLSAGMFGRRALVAGIGIAPCEGDLPLHAGGRLFPVLNELDCLADEGKNRGVVAACGDLFRNPFTAGFIMVPQQHVWASTKDLAATQRRGNEEIATLLAGRRGANFLETLRMLNWVAAPSTQHSAARTPWGRKWIHMLGYADESGRPIALTPDLPEQIGLLAGYHPEFIEVRLSDAAVAGASAVVSNLEAAFAPDVPPQTVAGAREGAVQFVLPSLSKTDLRQFLEARDAYDREDREQKLLDHSLLLEQGVLLSEPSTQLEGMAGASLAGTDRWIAVPLAELRGEDRVSVASRPGASHAA